MKKSEISCGLYFENSNNPKNDQFFKDFVINQNDIVCENNKKGYVIKTSSYIESNSLEEVLNILLYPLKPYISQIISLDSHVWLDICIIIHDKYPEMLLEGECMKIIHELKAEISFDIY